MKKAFMLFAAVLTSATLVQGASVVATNYDEAAGRQLPFSTASGAGFLTGGIVAVGTWNASNSDVAGLFAQLPNPTVWGQIVSSFIRFGDTSTVGGGFEGLYELSAQRPLVAADVEVGKNIYTLIGNAPTLAASTEAALVLDPGTFNFDNPLFAARADITNPSATVVFGSLNGPSVTSALGAAPSLKFGATVPEPFSATLLFAGLALGFRRRR
jgi:hypothetical protein